MKLSSATRYPFAYTPGKQAAAAYTPRTSDPLQQGGRPAAKNAGHFPSQAAPDAVTHATGTRFYNDRKGLDFSSAEKGAYIDIYA